MHKTLIKDLNPAFCKTDVNGSTKLILLRDWVTPYNYFSESSYATAEYWASKLGKKTDEFITDFVNGSLDIWFKVYYR